MRSTRAPVITFSSDFGEREYYVGAVKGVILSICPGAQIVDLTHHIASHDLLEAAFTLSCAYSTFPPRTVHLVVVDPGVGSKRRAIVLATRDHWFVAPDNGVLSLVYRREEVIHVVAVEAEHYFRRPIAPTFHGRDIFAPIAAQIARGLEVSRLGSPVTDYVRLNLPPLEKLANGRLQGIVLHIDKFGNIITSVTPEDIRGILGEERTPVEFLLNGRTIDRHCSYFAEAAEGELFSLLGSSGHYEIAARQKPAARILEAKRGMPVQLKL
ncbi:MAG: S-adenosyl-l-methionine hydroxide adenosyltransferase family protein [Acidobacteriota bacterium]